MAKSCGSYQVSRTNAMKYGISVKGPMTCPGRRRCRYRYCDDWQFEPMAGDPCPWEAAYAQNLEMAYRRTYDQPAVRERISDLDDAIQTLVHNALRRNRISFRSNQSWMLVGSPLLFWREFKLCDRYLASCLRELNELLARLSCTD